MKTFTSLPFFAASTAAPLFDVGDVFDQPTHPWHDQLLNDLAGVSEEELRLFRQRKPHLIHHMNEKTHTDLQWRIYFAIEELGNQIAMLRKQLLLKASSPPPPYDHPQLVNVLPDKNGLVNMHDLYQYAGGFYAKDEVFTLAPSTNANNSSYWLLQELNDPMLDRKVKIRLDPLVHHPKADFHMMNFRMQVYGKLLNWERIKGLVTPEQVEFIPDDADKSPISKTQIIWNPSDDEVHFTCEELPNIALLPYRGSRYFHAIFEKESGDIEHCDGAIRYYDVDQYNARQQTHIKAKEAVKAGTRIKIFHVTQPPRESFIKLVTSFFVWNEDLVGYFAPR